WLAHQHIPFIIRLKHNLQVDTPQGPVAVRTLFDDLERGKTRTLRQPRRLPSQDLFLSAKRLKDDTLVVLAAPTPIPRALRQCAALSLFRYGLDHLQALLAGGRFHLQALIPLMTLWLKAPPQKITYLEIKWV
ncbi:MAG: hypothetical protein ACFCBW_01770, partial [Candidatus Competibacterales bacterium]